MIQRDVRPWVSFMVKYKLKFLVLPIGFLSAIPFIFYESCKDFCNTFTSLVKYAYEDLCEMKQWLKGK